MKRLSLLWLVIAVTVAVLGLAGCGGDDTTAPGVNEFELLSTLGDTYFTNYTTAGGLGVNVAASAVYANLTDGNTANDPYILDWRGAADYANGHIAGAVNVSLSGSNIADVIGAVPAGKTVLNVCYTGQTASYVTSYMNLAGVEAQNLLYGMCGWTGDTSVNLSKWDNAIGDTFASWMVTDPTTAASDHEPPSFSTGQKNADDILAARAAQAFKTGWKTITATALYDAYVAGHQDDYFVINYFTAAPYNAGHIPGAVRFEPKADLKLAGMLKRIPTDKKVVVYCFTGQTSAQVVSYLNLLGYDAYSLVYGVNGMCYSNTSICTSQYHAATTNYPVVSGS